MFDNLFSGINSQSKEYIGISLNTNGLLEVIQTNKATSEIQKYTNRFVNYNAITREVESYDVLKEEIESSLTELNVNPKNCLVTISLPNVFFGITELPEFIANDEISNALISQIEESYIFKHQDPVISWYKLDVLDNNNVKLAYSALQESAVKGLKEICADLGINLISIQNSFSSALTGLSFSERLEKIIPADNSSWNILLISSTSFSIFNFIGNKLNNYYEEPLAVKSFTNEEVYDAVGSMASTALQNYPSKNLLIISETDEISAEAISSKFSDSTIPFYIEQNKFQQNPPLNVSLDVLPGLIPQITIAATGASVDHLENKTIKFNYLTTSKAATDSDFITIGNKTFEITKENVTKFTIIIGITLGIILGGLWLVLNNIAKGFDEKFNEAIQEEAKLQAELKSLSEQPTNVNITGSIGSIVKSNRKKMLYYDALSYGIPEKLWIESFFAGSGDAISINGVAMDSNDIAEFLKGIREVAGESEVSVTKLTITGSDDIINRNEPELYSFELTNQAFKTLVANTKNDAENNKTAQPQKQSQGQQQPKYAGNNIPPVNNQTAMPPVLPAE